MKTMFDKKDLVQGGLATFAMGFLLVDMLILAFVDIPKDNREMFNTVSTAGVIAGFGLVMNFFFGASKGGRLMQESMIEKAKEDK